MSFLKSLGVDAECPLPKAVAAQAPPEAAACSREMKAQL